jgi:hypothetical protein
MEVRVVRDYLWRVGHALSVLANVVFLNGKPNESVSARCYREGWEKAEEALDDLFWFDKNHCYNSHINERVWAREILK